MKDRNYPVILGLKKQRETDKGCPWNTGKKRNSL